MYTMKMRMDNWPSKLFGMRWILFVTVFLLAVMEGSVMGKPAVLRTDQRGYNDVVWKQKVDAYNHCYQIFSDGSGSSYKEVCRNRDKLILCKQKVAADFPKVEYLLNPGVEDEAEFTAKFWCIHKPDPTMPIEALYYKFYHTCFNVFPFFMVLPLDYSANERFLFSRESLAYNILANINVPHLTRWHPKQNYSDPADPVYQALSSIYCSVHRYHQYNANILDKYCIVGGVYRDLTEQIIHYEHTYLFGLNNWDLSTCPRYPEDPVLKVLNVVELKPWLAHQVNSSLTQCHSSNVAVRGGSCILMFYIRTAPFTDLHIFMQGFCKPMEELHQCWEAVSKECPKESVNSDMDVLVKLHHLACELSLQNSRLLWDVIYSWAEHFRQVNSAQLQLQFLSNDMYQIMKKPLLSTTVYHLPFASTLNATLTTQHNVTTHIRNLLHQVVSYLNRNNILETYIFQGLNIFHEIPRIGNIIASGLHGTVELFLTIGGFIDYDPQNFAQWASLIST